MQHKSAYVRRNAGWIGLGLAIAAAAALVPVFTANASPSAAPTPTTSPDGPWTITKNGGGYDITLHLNAPLPVRDALPELAVNGTTVGLAQQSTDGLTLTGTTTDPIAGIAKDVEVSWNGIADTAATSVTTTPKPALAPKKAAVTPDVTASYDQLTNDAMANGTYTVTRADYDLGDTALTLSGLEGKFSEERAAVWVPVDAPGERPVVIFLHGRHTACYNPTGTNTNNSSWPCPAGMIPVPSYLGYNASAQDLASHGYVVVSISADGINAQDANFSVDSGTLARGQLILDHLDLLAKANDGKAKGLSPLLYHKLDLTDVGLMGHSRGGEGVVKAALLNAAEHKPYGIKAVLPLAPIDFGQETLPDVPMAVMFGSCDGDVSNQQGQHFFDDTRYADTSDNVMRSSLMIIGADHNFFNSEWTPGTSAAPSSDDWSASNQSDPTCGQNAPTTTRLTAAQQYDVGTALISGFFRLTMGNEQEFATLFDGAEGPSTKVGAATVLTEIQAPSSAREDVAPLTGPSTTVRTYGAAVSTYCASIGATRSPSQPLAACTTNTNTSRYPSWTPSNYGGNSPDTPLLHFTWTVPTGTGAVGSVRADLPPTGYDISKYGDLTFRASVDDATAATDLTVTVVDGSGATQSVQVSSLSNALVPFVGGPTTLLPKNWLQTVQWPVSSMTSVNTHDIRQVIISAPATTGGAYLADLAFETPSVVGAGGPSTLPQISVVDTNVTEGNGPSEAPVTVTLSDKSKVDVTAWVQTLTATGGQVETQALPVTIPAGAKSATVMIPIDGNKTVQTTPVTSYKVFVVQPINAIIGQEFAHINVTDDDTAAG